MTRADDSVGGTERPPHVSAKAKLLEQGLVAKKSLGQNFLADELTCRRIAELVCPSAEGGVLEIGAGLGALTAPLLARGANVISVEIDDRLVQVLAREQRELIDSGRLRLLHADATELAWDELCASLPEPRRLCGNLPYHLSGLLLRRAIEVSHAIERAVFLLQLEVVERLCAAPGAPAYGALSVFAQAVYAPRRAWVVRRGAFYPQPNVDSAVVVLSPLAERGEHIGPEFTAFVRAAFEQRRKTLRNAWRGVLDLSAEDLVRAAREAAIDLALRGEVLSVADFGRMAREARRLRPESP